MRSELAGTAATVAAVEQEAREVGEAEDRLSVSS
jgi:hypothetical protein